MVLDSYLTQNSKDEYFRLYQWSQPTLSLGITNKISELNLDSIRKKNISVIYRETGGGVVFHDGDLCFSFINNMHVKPKENYNFIKKTLEKILFELGNNITKTYDINIKSSVCFHGSNTHEISIDNQKRVGIAQKVIKKRYLIQGSIQLKTCSLEDILSNNKKIVQYGLNDIKFESLKEKIYNTFAILHNLVDIIDSDILRKQDYIEFKQKNKHRFYKED